MSNQENKKSKFSINIPCYNEVGNVRAMAETIIGIMDKQGYPYQVFFIDNCSTDGTQDVLRELAAEYKQVKVIMNMRNYGVIDGRSFANAEKYKGEHDVAISIPCDFQESPELIPEFIHWWEQGYKVVCGQKTSSKEGKIKYGLRQIYYKIIQAGTEVQQYSNLSGILLIDRTVGKSLGPCDKDIDIRFKLADSGIPVKLIQYQQQARRSGKSSYNVWRYLSFAINSLVNTSTKPLRIITVIGFIMSFLSFCAGIVYLILKLVLWYNFSAGVAPMLIGMLFMGSVQLFFLGMIGEYIGVILRKMTKLPNVVLSEKLNIDDTDED